MRLTETPLKGLYLVEVTPHADDRGLFARVYDEDIFRAAGLHCAWPQSSVSFNSARGTLRGMHHQADPHPEPKLVRCARGRIYDVAVDIRPASPTFRRWFGVELTAEARNALYIPAGFAHGFVTLEDASEVHYQIGERYRPELARGFRWNDPAFSISWPTEPRVISERDAAYPDFAP
jgi:dTDP-4-dehydrorhamnose 3,5-epimerase